MYACMYVCMVMEWHCIFMKWVSRMVGCCICLKGFVDGWAYWTLLVHRVRYVDCIVMLCLAQQSSYHSMSM